MAWCGSRGAGVRGPIHGGGPVPAALQRRRSRGQPPSQSAYTQIYKQAKGEMDQMKALPKLELHALSSSSMGVAAIPRPQVLGGSPEHVCARAKVHVELVMSAAYTHLYFTATGCS